MSRFAPRGQRPKMTWDDYFPLHKPTVQALINVWGGEVTEVTSEDDVLVTRPSGERFLYHPYTKMVTWEAGGGASLKVNINYGTEYWTGYSLPAAVILEHEFDSTLAAEYQSKAEAKKALKKAFFEEARSLLGSLGVTGVYLSSADPDSGKVTLYKGRNFQTCPISEMEAVARKMAGK